MCTTKKRPQWCKIICCEKCRFYSARKEENMTKEEFYKKVNFASYPKYVFSQIKEGNPTKDCASIVCTASGNILLAKYENGKWYQACFTSAPDQRMYYMRINENVIFWTDGKAEDTSRGQFE